MLRQRAALGYLEVRRTRMSSRGESSVAGLPRKKSVVALTLKLVGMKRLDLHGTVVAGSPHTYQRAHRLATRHTPGGQPWI